MFSLELVNTCSLLFVVLSLDCCTLSSINKPVKNNIALLLLSTSNKPVILQATAPTLKFDVRENCP